MSSLPAVVIWSSLAFSSNDAGNAGGGHISNGGEFAATGIDQTAPQGIGGGIAFRDVLPGHDELRPQAGIELADGNRGFFAVAEGLALLVEVVLPVPDTRHPAFACFVGGGENFCHFGVGTVRCIVQQWVFCQIRQHRQQVGAGKLDIGAVLVFVVAGLESVLHEVADFGFGFFLAIDGAALSPQPVSSVCTPTG